MSLTHCQCSENRETIVIMVIIFIIFSFSFLLLYLIFAFIIIGPCPAISVSTGSHQTEPSPRVNWKCLWGEEYTVPGPRALQREILTQYKPHYRAAWHTLPQRPKNSGRLGDVLGMGKNTPLTNGNWMVREPTTAKLSLNTGSPCLSPSSLGDTPERGHGWKAKPPPL